MNFLKTFKEKVTELEKARKYVEKTEKILSSELENLIQLTVQILDNINKKTINIKINIDNITLYKIEHENNYNIGNDIILHKKGIETLIYYKENSVIKNISLWNTSAGQGVRIASINYSIVAETLKYLIEKYPENYKNVEQQNAASKYNL